MRACICLLGSRRKASSTYKNIDTYHGEIQAAWMLYERYTNDMEIYRRGDIGVNARREIYCQLEIHPAKSIEISMLE